MRLNHDRANTLHSTSNDHATESLRIARDEVLRGIAYGDQSRAIHLVDTEVVGRAEAVLMATQDAVEMLLVALKLQDRVYRMLQDLRARYGALFVDMTNDDHGYAAALGKVQEQVGALLNLADGAR